MPFICVCVCDLSDINRNDKNLNILTKICNGNKIIAANIQYKCKNGPD